MIDKVGIDCTGCGSCAGGCPHEAIYMKPNEEGFLIPLIDSSICTRCNLCERVCPALNEASLTNSIIDSFAALTDNRPQTSSSGGAFFSIASAVIRKCGVVYGAAFSDSVRIIHIRVDSLDELPRLCGSKYIQSSIDREIFHAIKKDLQDGMEVLFSGTPCQVKGLKLFLRKEYANLILIDLICHGVSSPGVFNSYIRYIERLRHRKVKEFRCRDNREGWSNIFKSTIIYVNDGEEYNSVLANLWNRIFFSEMITRQSCHACKFANKNRYGDFTLGDFWGIKGDEVPSSNKSGVSLLFVNTPKGRAFMETTDLSLKEAQTNSKEHPNLYRPTPPSPMRQNFFDCYKMNGFSNAIGKYFQFSAWLDFKIRVHKMIFSR